MHTSTSITGAAVLLALAPSVLAVGTATLYNNCGFPIYYADVSSSAAGMTELGAGGAFSVGYSNPGEGFSIKIAPTDSLTSGITQFEYTWSSGKINYDISNINGNPFASEGMVLTPSMAGDPNNPTCVPVNCPAGQSVCTAAYNQPDDTDTMVCSDASSLVMTICTGGSSKERREALPMPEPLPEAVAEPMPIPLLEAKPVLAPIMHLHQRIHSRHILKK